MSVNRGGTIIKVYFENNLPSCMYMEIEEDAKKIIWQKLDDFKEILNGKRAEVKKEIINLKKFNNADCRKRNYCNMVNGFLRTLSLKSKNDKTGETNPKTTCKTVGYIKIGTSGKDYGNSESESLDSGDCGIGELHNFKNTHNIDDEHNILYLLKALYQMMQDVIEIIEKLLLDQKCYCKYFYDVIIYFLESLSPLVAKAIRIVERNYNKIWEFLIEYYNENRNPSLEDLTNFIQSILNCNKFGKMFDIYKEILEKSVCELVGDSLNLVLNTFAFVYTHFVIPKFLEIIKDGLEKRNDQILCNIKMVKGYSLLIIKVTFESVDELEENI